jgi:bleomycin hydrolase
MGANNSKEQEQEQIDTFDEKRAETMAIAKQGAASSLQGKYLTQSMAAMDLNEQQCKEHYSRLTPRVLDKFSEHFWHDKTNKLAMNALKENDPATVLVSHESALKQRHVFNVKLDLEGAATNQKASGRCWIFAGKL